MRSGLPPNRNTSHKGWRQAPNKRKYAQPNVFKDQPALKIMESEIIIIFKDMDKSEKSISKDMVKTQIFITKAINTRFILWCRVKRPQNERKPKRKQVSSKYKGRSKNNLCIKEGTKRK